eukprot:5731377-Pyramimonas_sp.AAC.1
MSRGTWVPTIRGSASRGSPWGNPPGAAAAASSSSGAAASSATEVPMRGNPPADQLHHPVTRPSLVGLRV